MKFVRKFFLSMISAIVLFLVFGAACGIATFIESINDTQTAWALVYGTWWFAAIHIWLGVNLTYNIFHYNLITPKKLPALMFHVSFLFILLGAGLTRYFGNEWQMRIREGQESALIQTSKSFVQLREFQTKSFTKKDLYIASSGQNSFSLNLDVPDFVNATTTKKATLTYTGFVKNGVESFVESEDGEPLAEVLFSDANQSQSVVLHANKSLEIADVSFTFNAAPKSEKFISIDLAGDKFGIKTNVEVVLTNMKTMQKTHLKKGESYALDEFSVFTFDEINFSFKKLLKKASKGVVAGGEKERGANAILARLSYNGTTKDVYMFEGAEGSIFGVGGKLFSVAWSPLFDKLPFALRLNKFELDRYPGSKTPASYASEVTVVDGEKSFDYRIFMNHVLDHRGFRFFQSSYDMDEKGTILSVNSDPGKLPTYFGYFLLGLGFLLNVLNPYSRFRKLANLVSKEQANDGTQKPKRVKGKGAAAVLVAFFVAFASAPVYAAGEFPVMPESHLKALGELVVQSNDGRMKPFDSVATETLNKIYRASSFEGIPATQALLFMMLDSDYWRKLPIVKVSNKEVKNVLGIPAKQNAASFDDFFVANGEAMEYKLTKYSEVANRKKPSGRSVFDKEILKADERLNVLYMAFMGELFRVLPKQNDPNNTWYSVNGLMMGSGAAREEVAEAFGLVRDYFGAVGESLASKDFTKADIALQKLKAYQLKFGKAVIPSESKIGVEILFNSLNLFDKITPVYLIVGLLLLGVVFARMVSSRRFELVFKFGYVVNLLLFVLLAFGLGLRWYISGHAPWSNAYESMIFIAWSLALSGIVFAKRSLISLALTAILAGVVLFTAHLSWMDPQITTLMPVLKSHWLTIHVSVITASYGFLGLCCLLGFFTLVLFAVGRDSEVLRKNITEATRINEMAMILGLSLLTFGNFLGGVWANESWGRYWGWDSKETWALVSILVYAAVTHARFVPRMNSQYAFAVMSMFGYWVIVMTYFGVNFYLTGMHSYAAGESMGVPGFVYVIVAVMVAVALAGLRGKRLNQRL